MRLSAVFAPTLRDDPAEAEIASHRLLLRAAFVRQVAAGIYTTLPLGLRSIRKIERIGRAEMNAARAPGVRDANPAARRTVAGDRPVGPVRRHALSAPGPARAGATPRPHARGGRGRARCPRSPVVQGPSREPVQGRVEVP